MFEKIQSLNKSKDETYSAMRAMLSVSDGAWVEKFTASENEVLEISTEDRVTTQSLFKDQSLMVINRSLF